MTPSLPEAEPSEPEHRITSPTVAHRWLTIMLLAKRLERRMRQSDVAKLAGWSHGKVGHIETRHVGLRREDLRVLLEIYEVPENQQERYYLMADRSREKGWWEGAPGVPDWFSAYVGLEWGADSATLWQQGFVPGLLQTPEYARAVIEEGAAPDGEVEDKLNQRLRRQDVLNRPVRPLQLHAVIDEGVLHRLVGGAQVMRDQLVALRDMNRRKLPAQSPTRSSNVQLQVLLHSAGGHDGLLGSFTHLRFSHDEDFGADEALVQRRNELDPGIVYVENQFNRMYLDDREHAERATRLHEDLAARALSPEQSADLIDDLAQRIGG